MPPPDPKTVVEQVHKECLDALFARDYYKVFHATTTRYANVFDFAIALGSALSGGTGLGILANPAFGWLCGGITSLSVLLSIAKGVYNWPGKTKFAIERVQFYGSLYGKYQALVDDMNAAREWNDKFASQREALRVSANSGTADAFGDLSMDKQRAIQQGIKARIKYKEWWKP